MGCWKYHVAWGNWHNFVSYTIKINPWASTSIAQFLAIASTIAEIVLGIFLILGVKTELTAKLSGFLLLAFALAMTFSTGIKTAFDASVFAASAGAFALATMKQKYLEIDTIKFH